MKITTDKNYGADEDGNRGHSVTCYELEHTEYVLDLDAFPAERSPNGLGCFGLHAGEDLVERLEEVNLTPDVGQHRILADSTLYGEHLLQPLLRNVLRDVQVLHLRGEKSNIPHHQIVTDGAHVVVGHVVIKVDRCE